MEISAIKNWLQYIGADFDVREAHNRFRNGMKPPADHFVFNIAVSQPIGDHAVVDKEASSYDNSTSFSKRFRTLVEVSCEAENAVLVMQSLDASTSMEAVRDFFGASVVCLGLISDIVDSTEYDETHGEVARQTRYTATFEFQELITYTKTLTNDIWDEYELTGTLVEVDDETETTVTAEYSTGDPSPPEL